MEAHVVASEGRLILLGEFVGPPLHPHCLLTPWEQSLARTSYFKLCEGRTESLRRGEEKLEIGHLALASMPPLELSSLLLQGGR